MGEVERFKEFCKSEHDCPCMDKSFEEFNKCCGKKFGIENPLDIMFSMVNEMAKKSSVPRLRDMEPEQAEKVLKKIMSLSD